MRRAVILALFACLGVAVPASAQAATLNVSANGSDSTTCTASAPCKSLARAYSVAASG